MNNNENTQSRLLYLMKKRGLRQVDILNLVDPHAKKHDIKFNKSDLSQYISGKSEPNQRKLFILSEALGVSPSWLMGFGKTELEDDTDKASLLKNNPKSSLSSDDEKDIAKTMWKLKEQLLHEQGLMFDGELLDEETIRLVLEEIEQQERIIKAVNKKYIPKKYR